MAIQKPINHFDHNSVLGSGFFTIKLFTKVSEGSVKSWGVVHHSCPDSVYSLIDLRPRSNLVSDQLLLTRQHEDPHKLHPFSTRLTGRIPANKVQQELHQVISGGDGFCLEVRSVCKHAKIRSYLTDRLYYPASCLLWRCVNGLSCINIINCRQIIHSSASIGMLRYIMRR